MTANETTLSTTGGVLLKAMVCSLVDLPAAVEVQEIKGIQSVVLEVKVDSVDMKRVIGRGGRTADALRELLRNIGGKEGRRYTLALIEPDGVRRTAPVARLVRTASQM